MEYKVEEIVRLISDLNLKLIKNEIKRYRRKKISIEKLEVK